MLVIYCSVTSHPETCKTRAVCVGLLCSSVGIPLGRLIQMHIAQWLAQLADPRHPPNLAGGVDASLGPDLFQVAFIDMTVSEQNSRKAK